MAPAVGRRALSAFLGSANSRYYAGVVGSQIFMATDECVLWRREVPYERFELLGLGGNGHLYVCVPDGIVVYQPHAAEAVPLARWSRDELLRTSSQMGNARVSPDGRRLCVQRSTVQARTSQKIFEFLSATRVEPNATLHELILHTVSTDETSVFYRTMLNDRDASIIWDVSPDFDWIVMAEPQKGDQLRFSVAHIPSQTIYHEFAVPRLALHALRVGRGGNVLLDVSQGETRGIVIVSVEGKRSTITVPTRYELCYLGGDFVAMRTLPTPFLLVKGFDDELRYHADLRPLSRMDLHFDVCFNEHEGIDLITFSDGAMKVVHSSLDYLEIDARRWEKLADSHEEEKTAPAPAPPSPQRRLELNVPERTAIQPMPSVDGVVSKTVAGRPERLFLDFESSPDASVASQKSGLREATATDDAKAPPPAPRGVVDETERKRVERLLELLEERFILGQVSEETYSELKRKYHLRLRG